jgi:hypothetical protein
MQMTKQMTDAYMNFNAHQKLEIYVKWLIYFFWLYSTERIKIILKNEISDARPAALKYGQQI